MMKCLLTIALGFLVCGNLYSQGGRKITINYQHSRRIPYNIIDIEFRAEKLIYQINVSTKQMEGKSGYEYSNTEKTFAIEKEYFDEIYGKILNLDFKEIIINNENIVGGDGTTITITVGSYHNNIVINLWSPDYKSQERGTNAVNEIIHDVFSMIGLEEYI